MNNVFLLLYMVSCDISAAIQEGAVRRGARAMLKHPGQLDIDADDPWDAVLLDSKGPGELNAAIAEQFAARGVPVVTVTQLRSAPDMNGNTTPTRALEFIIQPAGDAATLDGDDIADGPGFDELVALLVQQQETETPTHATDTEDDEVGSDDKDFSN